MLFIRIFAIGKIKKDNKMGNEMSKKEMDELAADVVAIVKKQRQMQAPKYGSVLESIVGAIKNDARCREKGGRV